LTVFGRALHTGALFALAAAAFAVAGCGGGGSTPAAVATATPTPAATPTVAASPSLSFTFASAGGSANISPGASGSGTLTSGAAVGGVTISSTWGANNATSTVAMTAQVATGNGDITPNSPTAFPPFATTQVVDNNGNPISGYTLIDYLKVTATPVTTFTQTPAIVVSGAAGASGKSTCSYFSLGGSTSAPQWQQAVPGTISGTTVTIAAQTLTGGATIGNGSTNVAYLALACK
jgi:hypothetical protein